jgi:hypothetical protein
MVLGHMQAIEAHRLRCDRKREALVELGSERSI